MLSYWLFVNSLAFLCLLSLASASVRVGRIAYDEESLFLSEPVIQFCFTDGVLKGLLYNCYPLITSSVIYCECIALEAADALLPHLLLGTNTDAAMLLTLFIYCYFLNQ